MIPGSALSEVPEMANESAPARARCKTTYRARRALQTIVFVWILDQVEIAKLIWPILKTAENV